MVDIKNTASGLARYLACELDLDPKNTEVIRYGMEIILGALLKGLIIFGFSYWLGIVPYVLAALITSSIFRLLSGGAHCNTYMRCLIFSLTILLLIGILSRLISPYVKETSLLLSVIAQALVGLYFVKKWVPVDNPNKPIPSEKKGKFKKLSAIYVITWATVMILSLFNRAEISVTYPVILASMGGFTVQLLSLCPAGCRMIGRIDRMLGKFFA